MVVHPSEAWKLALAVALAGGIFFSLWGKAPRRAASGRELHRLVLSAVTLYAVGAYAWLTHHPGLAELVFVAGTSVASFAAWLSRGARPEDPLSEDGIDPEPPAEPQWRPEVDWDDFEYSFRAYSEREREPAR